MATLLDNAQVITPQGVFDGWLVWDGKRITHIGTVHDAPPPTDTLVDGGGNIVLPGFIDVHVHGALGHDTMDGDLRGLIKQAEFYVQHGVTSFLPTTLTNSREAITTALDTIQQGMQTSHQGSTILGAYVEGPYLNVEKAGAQNPEFIRTVDRDEAAEWLDTGIIKIMTVAPEFSENDWLIQECARRGITVSAAHTNATYMQMLYAIGMGVSQTTHTFNGMRGFHHREPGIIGAAFEDDSVYCEVIADNLHVHPSAMEVLWRAKGAKGVILITDSTRATGMPDGEYEIGGQTFMMKDRESRLSDGTLAGSTATMDNVVGNFARLAGGLPNMWQTSSYNAACQIGVQDQKGMLKVGYDADLVVMSPDYKVMITIVEGDVRYQAH